MSSEEIAAVLTDLPAQGPPALVVDRVTRAFEQLGSPEDAQGVSHFIPGAEHTYGLRIAQLRAMGKHVAKHYDYNMCRSIARASWPRGSREHRMFALFLLEASKLSPAECWELGLEFLPGVLTWEDCDQLCGATLGRALSKDPAYMDQLETWLDDENFWVRRAALVSTVLLRRASYPLDLAYQLDIRTLAMCAALLEDKEPYVRKAVDWTVRETLRRNYKLVRDWLLEQARANPSRNARTTLKLSAKKLNDDDRAAFLAALGED
jgi:3-methyladenine DNA glycosylase AlkD